MSPKQLATHTVWRRAIVPWWRTYFLKNKHTLPSSAPRMQPLTTQWSSVVPLKHPARGEPSQAVGAEITGLRLYSTTNLPTWLFTPHSSPFNLTALQSRTQSSQLWFVFQGAAGVYFLAVRSEQVSPERSECSLGSLPAFSMAILELWTQPWFCC